MNAEDRQFIESLRQAMERKTDPGEREELRRILEAHEHYYSQLPEFERQQREDDALLAKTQKVLLWARIGIAAFVLVAFGATAWFIGKVLHLF